jgi:hypothetical protein
MFDRQELYARRCVRTLVEVIEQVPARWATRAPMVLDESSVGMLLLWTLVRWERRFPLSLLEEMDIDIWAFTRDIDNLLNRKKLHQVKGNENFPMDWMKDFSSMQLLQKLTDLWLQRAELVAQDCKHPFLGAEHLLLALVAGADPSWAALFPKNGIDYERLKNLTIQALESKPLQASEIAIDAIVLPQSCDAPYSSERPIFWGVAWDKPATGIPRKFGIAILMLMVTLFAMMFSLFKWINAPAVVYGIFGVLVFGVALGQMFLFGGKYPRAASIWTGAVLLPIEIFVINIFSNFFNMSENVVERLIITFILLFLIMPFGAFFGYLAGGLSAGVVLLLEWQKSHDQSASDEN